jgi:mitochondrial inner membrane protease subunit 2
VLFDRFTIGFRGRWDREDIVALKYVFRSPHARFLCVFTYLLIRSPIDPKIFLVKRIVALEGDIVKTLPPYPDTEVTIPPGHVWVEGVNIFTFF